MATITATIPVPDDKVALLRAALHRRWPGFTGTDQERLNKIMRGHLIRDATRGQLLLAEDAQNAQDWEGLIE